MEIFPNCIRSDFPLPRANYTWRAPCQSAKTVRAKMCTAEEKKTNARAHCRVQIARPPNHSSQNFTHAHVCVGGGRVAWLCGKQFIIGLLYTVTIYLGGRLIANCSHATLYWNGPFHPSLCFLMCNVSQRRKEIGKLMISAKTSQGWEPQTFWTSQTDPLPLD